MRRMQGHGDDAARPADHRRSPAARSVPERSRRRTADRPTPVDRRGPRSCSAIAIVGWVVTFSVLVVPEARPVRVGRLRHGHPRPERLAARAPPRLPDRPRPPGVRPPRDARLLPLRPLLLVGRRPAPPQHHPGLRRRASARCRCSCSRGSAPAARGSGPRSAIAFLLHPALQFFMSELFHPEVLAITPLLCAYYCSVRKRWAWFACFAVLAVCWKEDVALAVAILGLVIALRGDRRVGLHHRRRRAGVVLRVDRRARSRS